MTDFDTERGSATVHATLLIGSLCAVAVVGASVVALYVGHRQAGAAADLAALAGASALMRGDKACSVADAIARDNGAVLDDCRVDGDVLTISVTVDVPSLFGRTHEVEVRARAGPAP